MSDDDIMTLFLRRCMQYYVVEQRKPCFEKTRLGVVTLNIHGEWLSPFGILLDILKVKAPGFPNMINESRYIRDNLRTHTLVGIVVGFEEVHDSMVSIGSIASRKVFLPLIIRTADHNSLPTSQFYDGDNLTQLIVATAWGKIP